MITIPEEVERIIKRFPYLEEALASGLLNLSSLARQFKPEIEKKLYKNVQLGAIIMSLKRLEESLQKQQKKMQPLLVSMKDMTVRSNLVELAFVNSGTLVVKQKELLEKFSGEPGYFLAFTRGVYNTTLIISASLKKQVKAVFEEEKVVFEMGGLSAITITFSQDTIKTPGVYYSILKALAWENVNIVEIISSVAELTIIFEDAQINQAFAVLKDLTKED